MWFLTFFRYVRTLLGESNHKTTIKRVKGRYKQAPKATTYEEVCYGFCCGADEDEDEDDDEDDDEDELLEEMQPKRARPILRGGGEARAGRQGGALVVGTCACFRFFFVGSSIVKSIPEQSCFCEPLCLQVIPRFRGRREYREVGPSFSGSS